VEYGEFERLGSEDVRVADVRLISATHETISRLAQSDRFRHDLFFRISAIVITIPPLRERMRDLPLLLVSEISRTARAQRKTIIGPDKAAAERIFPIPGPAIFAS
jgi:transcriptional regulator with PAS, ATPase and Fis domain